jgi:Protein of unknown function (DUF2637)
VSLIAETRPEVTLTMQPSPVTVYGPGTVHAHGTLPARQAWPWWERVLLAAAVVGLLLSSGALYAYAKATPGFNGWTALGLPLIVEMLMLALGRTALARVEDGIRPGLAGLGFWAGILVAVMLNYLHAVPAVVPATWFEAGAIVPALLPPLAGTLAYKVVMQERKRRTTGGTARGTVTSTPGPAPAPQTSTEPTTRTTDQTGERTPRATGPVAAPARTRAVTAGPTGPDKLWAAIIQLVIEDREANKGVPTQRDIARRLDVNRGRVVRAIEKNRGEWDRLLDRGLADIRELHPARTG